MKVVEEDWQVIVKATTRMKVELQDTRWGQRHSSSGTGLVGKPQLQTQGKLGPLDALFEMAAVNWKGEMRFVSIPG